MNHQQLATDFLQQVISGKIDEAYEQYVDMKGKHHNVFFPAGFESLKQAMKESQSRFPNKQFTIKNIIDDGKHVVIHSHLRFQPDDPGMITVHMFRFENNKIVEMWDCGQIIPEDCPNTDEIF
jgi:predicted SnoaL-like aldol condensation-catalyzing enzyme